MKKNNSVKKPASSKPCDTKETSKAPAAPKK